ncbi:hypothetical protein [Ktedonospora formicarum]|uniref:Uncharacterized protein n=1 Tax=Ktedonospora formicarum TaxID=2778364 RepID=A0A8J3HTV0_9CHLR|nr:hypothetical protein [Ktedonospora formicarum]GHO43892.1 hypothetical protein KSX_20550 [Ktedonospora formicarum]
MMSDYDYYDPTRTLISSCPNCGARPQARIWSNIAMQPVSVYATSASIMGWGKVASMIHPLVCSRCGLVQFFTDPRNFQADTDGVVKEAEG